MIYKFNFIRVYKTLNHLGYYIEIFTNFKKY